MESSTENHHSHEAVSNVVDAEMSAPASSICDQSKTKFCTLEDANCMARSFTRVIDAVETIPIEASLGHRLFQHISAQIDIPTSNQSAMDGYALAGHVSNATYLLQDGNVRHSPPLKRGCAQAVSIGSELPKGADRVVLERYTNQLNTKLVVTKDVEQGACIRLQGEDVRIGEKLFTKGARLDARKISVLMSQRMKFVDVKVQPRIAFFSIVPNQIGLQEDVDAALNNNIIRLLLREAVERAGAVFVDGEICLHTPGNIGHHISLLSDKSDMIVFCAGSSSSIRALISQALKRTGVELSNLNIAMKPGKPVAIGRHKETALLQLPDHPFASFVMWQCLGRSMLDEMLGLRTDLLKGDQVPCVNGLKRRPGKSEFAPVKCITASGLKIVELLCSGGTARMLPLAHADGLAYLSAEKGDLLAGENVTFLPFSERACSE